MEKDIMKKENHVQGDNKSSENEYRMEILSNIYSQISSFDSKAGIALSVIGIVYALLLDFTNIYDVDCYLESTAENLKKIYNWLFPIFCTIGAISILFFIIVLFPRGHKKGKTYINYYKDVSKMKDEEYKERIKKGFTSDEIDDQIKVNAKICNKKDIWLRLGFFSLIPLAITLNWMVILIVLIFNK